MPKGVREPENFPDITAELVKRGYSERDILKILGGNLMRLFEQVW
ncbi:MAG: membrane dipeptidase [Candidatus Hydrogenedentes bacterium]|nr:membrane dipeptidase [Candidatus Hydrogenedentota bacterium]